MARTQDRKADSAIPKITDKGIAKKKKSQNKTLQTRRKWCHIR